MSFSFRRPAPVLAALVLASAALSATAQTTNTPPRFSTTPDAIVDIGREYRYAPRATDAEGDAITIEIVSAPPGAAFDDANVLRWRARADQKGRHSLVLRARDAHGATTDQSATLRAVPDFCPLYPIALPFDALGGLTPGTRVARLPRGVGHGNFSWLTWAGGTDAPTLAQSLSPPGDSDSFVEPGEPTDRQPDAGDWVQGAPGSMNASAVRTQLEALLTRDIA